VRRERRISLGEDAITMTPTCGWRSAFGHSLRELAPLRGPSEFDSAEPNEHVWCAQLGHDTRRPWPRTQGIKSLTRTKCFPPTSNPSLPLCERGHPTQQPLPLPLCPVWAETPASHLGTLPGRPREAHRTLYRALCLVYVCVAGAAGRGRGGGRRSGGGSHTRAQGEGRGQRGDCGCWVLSRVVLHLFYWAGWGGER